MFVGTGVNVQFSSVAWTEIFSMEEREFEIGKECIIREAQTSFSRSIFQMLLSRVIKSAILKLERE